MKVIGIILILLGIGLLIFQGVRSTEKEKIIDVGPIEINKKVERNERPAIYVAGGVAILVGLILVIFDRKKATT